MNNYFIRTTYSDGLTVTKTFDRVLNALDFGKRLSKSASKPAGVYRIEFIVFKERGDEVIEEKPQILFENESAKPTTELHEWSTLY